MRAAIDDVHHGHGQNTRLRAANISIERQGGGIGCGLGGRHGDAENGIGAELRLVGRAVEFDHGLVDGDLIFGLHTHKGFIDRRVDALDGLLDALAAIAALVTITQLHGLVSARRRT